MSTDADSWGFLVKILLKFGYNKGIGAYVGLIYEKEYFAGYFGETYSLFTRS